MTTLDSKIFGPLFGDAEINELLTDEAYVRALVEVETALAKAEARLGVIPSSAAEQTAAGSSTTKSMSQRLLKARLAPAFLSLRWFKRCAKPLAEKRRPTCTGARRRKISSRTPPASLQLRAAIGLFEAPAHSRDRARSRRAFKSAPRHCLGRTHPWPAGAAGQLRLEGCRMACAFDSPRRAAG